MKNRLTAALLAIFGGFIGAHQFYLRRPGVGIAFVFMFMFFKMATFFSFPFLSLTGLLGLIHGIQYLMMSDQEFDRRYNGATGQNNGWPSQERYSGRGRWTNPQSRPQQQPYPSQQQSRGWRNVEIDPAGPRRNVYKETGMRKYKDFDLSGAIEDFNKSLQLEPNDIATHFNLACAYSLTEQPEKAYQHIVKAVGLGFNDFDRLNTHDDLAFVRIQAQWDDFKASGYKTYKPFDKSPLPENVQPEPQNDMLLEQLNKLNELRQKGLISDAEYATEKGRLNQ